MIGTVLTYKGQAYTFLGEEPHTKADGTPTRLRLWRTACAECGKPFTFAQPVLAIVAAPSRRCAKHKRPGARVKTKKGAG